MSAESAFPVEADSWLLYSVPDLIADADQRLDAIERCAYRCPACDHDASVAEFIPACSPIGVGITTALALTLIVLGLIIAVTRAPMSGATIAAVLLIALGGSVLARITRVTR